MIPFAVCVTVVACSSSKPDDGGDQTEGALRSRSCRASDCGPRPGMPNHLCDDGVTMAGPGACEKHDGQCSWTIVECPADAGAPDAGTDCTPAECGPPPALGIALHPCDDGVTIEGTTSCKRVNGACTWKIAHCPRACGTQTCGADQTCCSGMPFANPTCIDGEICPISQAKKKKDIAYLSEAQKKELSSQLMDFRLATYRYKNESADDREHLGFIIDDVSGSPAVMASGERVDMYGYQTMAVATIQLQAEALESLQKEVSDLRREVKALRRGH